jgi:hypothetical protein
MIATWVALMVGWTLAHPVMLLVFGGLAAAVVVCTALFFYFTDDASPRSAHPPSGAAAKTPGRGAAHRVSAGASPGARRPAAPVRGRAAGEPRVWRRALTSARRLPGDITWAHSSPVRPGRHEPGLSAEDASTLTWLRSMRGLRKPGWNAFTLRRQLAVARALLNVPGRGDPARFALPHATATTAMEPPVGGSGEPAGRPAGGTSKPVLLTHTDTALWPGRPPEVAHDEYAPIQRWETPPSHTRLVPAADRPTITAQVLATVQRIEENAAVRAAQLAAEAEATRPWQDDTGTFTALCAADAPPMLPAGA